MLIKTPIRFSEHARINMSQRAVSKEEVFTTLLTPTEVYPRDGKKCFVKDDLTIVIAENENSSTVVTILLNKEGRKDWNNADARNRRKAPKENE